MARWVGVTIAAWAALLVGAGAASAASFTVDSVGDGSDAAAGNGACATAAAACTLRAAIEETQALGGANSIGFDLPDPSTIDLNSALPVIGAPATALDITGPGMGSLTVRRAGGGDYSVINTNVIDVSVSGMTITNGRAQVGAGIQSTEGELALDDVAVVRNAAVGPAASGGGVAKTLGAMRVRRSTISENSATADGASGSALGGGIQQTAGTLEIIESTIDHNSATHVSGGTAIAIGGGIATVAAPTYLVNSTVSANSVTATGPDGITAFGGGIFDALAILSTTGSTIAFNAAPAGANLYAGAAAVAVRDTVVSNPVAGANCAFASGAGLLSAGFNLASDTSCALTAAGDQQPADPLLGPLAFNGGPTRTHALALGSPAVDRGSAAASGAHPALTTDQRGQPRPFDVPTIDNAADGADIGAFELQVNRPPVAANDAYAVTGGDVLIVSAPGVLGNDSDPDGDALSAQLVEGPASGNLVLGPDGSFHYVPAEDAVSGQVTFTYRAFDGVALSNVATVTITVTAGCDGVAATITGTAGNDTLKGTSGNDVIIGRGGNDRIDPGSGNDRVCGDSGADTVELSSGNDLIFGGSGNDTLAGGSGDDTLHGGEGDDRLDGGGDRDRLFGEAGVDALFGGGDPDALDGGSGTPDRCDGEGGSDTATACEVRIDI